MSPEHTRNRRHLILFRHAKSARPEGVEDHDRPLAERGTRDAPAMGAWLARSKLVPDLVLVSTAARTRETWSLASGGFVTPPSSEERPEIYEATSEALLGLIRDTESAVQTLMLVGHNPGTEDLARMLMADDGGEAGRRLREKFLTAAIAVLSFDVESWSDIGPAMASLDLFETPRSISGTS